MYVCMHRLQLAAYSSPDPVVNNINAHAVARIAARYYKYLSSRLTRRALAALRRLLATARQARSSGARSAAKLINAHGHVS